MEDVERISEFVKRIAANEQQIRVLERELAAVRAGRRKAESLPAFLERLQMRAHLAALEEEELDVELLRSMGREDLASNMALLGICDFDIARMADDLFPNS